MTETTEESRRRLRRWASRVLAQVAFLGFVALGVWSSTSSSGDIWLLFIAIIGAVALYHDAFGPRYKK